jgi:hypothetical protein
MTPHEHAQISYGQQWKARLSKKHNVLKNYVSYKGDCSGRYATIEQFGELDLEEKTARHENKPGVELPTYRRFIFPKSFNQKVKFDEDDGWKLNRLGVPMPQSAQRLMQAGQRKVEEIMFNGMLGTATIGDGANESQTTATITEFVAANFTGAAAGLVSAKVLEGLRIFMDNDAWGQDSVTDEPDQLCLAASPKSLLNLWNETVVTSSDFRQFAGGKPFDTGILENFLGVKLMVTTALATNWKTGDIQTIPMWMKSKVTYGDWKTAETRVWQDNDTGGDRIRFKFTGGATREEEKGVTYLLCDESV